MNILEEIFTKVKEKFHIDLFNPMQEEAFEIIPKASDTILLSATGSGKTLAFLIPIMSQISIENIRTQCIIIVPTRELALQISNVAKNMALGFNIEVCYGGHPIRFEKKALNSKPHIIIGTPGRLQDHLDRENIETKDIFAVIMDEFDKTLEMGFHKQMSAILRHFKNRPQYILTSATESLEIPDFLRLRSPYKINYLGNETIAGLSIKLVTSPQKDKLETLYYLLNDIAHESTFVFCNYRETVERVSQYLTSKNIANDILHGGLDQVQRENVLSKFRNGSTRLLITTDLAGRGLDIPEVEHVVHYHHPITEEVYIHRNGRTARMGAFGQAYVIVYEGEDIPEYIGEIPNEYFVTREIREIPSPEWSTLHINKGKRDKINKVDVVGFLSKIGNLEKSDVGIVELKDNYALAAVKKHKLNKAIELTDNKKMKGKSVIVREL